MHSLWALMKLMQDFSFWKKEHKQLKIKKICYI